MQPIVCDRLGQRLQKGGEGLLDPTRCVVKVDLRVQMIARKDEGLRRLQGLFLKSKGLHGIHSRFVTVAFLERRRRADHTQIVHQPVEIDRTGARSTHQPVALKVVEPIGIEGARNNGRIDVGRICGQDFRCKINHAWATDLLDCGPKGVVW